MSVEMRTEKSPVKPAISSFADFVHGSEGGNAKQFILRMHQHVMGVHHESGIDLRVKDYSIEYTAIKPGNSIVYRTTYDQIETPQLLSLVDMDEERAADEYANQLLFLTVAHHHKAITEQFPHARILVLDSTNRIVPEDELKEVMEWAKTRVDEEGEILAPYESGEIERPGDLPVISFDLDGVVFPRIPAQTDAIKFWRWKKHFKPKEENLAYDDRVVHEKPSTVHRLDAKRQLRRLVTERFFHMIDGVKMQMAIGNTGRPFHRMMAEGTVNELEEADVAHMFEEVFFKPMEMKSSDETKYWALKGLLEQGFKNVIHFDDNAFTIHKLATALPEVNFVLFEDATSSFIMKRKGIKAPHHYPPNVARIKLLKDGKILVRHKPKGWELPFDQDILQAA